MASELVMNRNSVSNFPSHDGNDTSQNTEVLTRRQSVPSYKISRTAHDILNVQYFGLREKVPDIFVRF